MELLPFPKQRAGHHHPAGCSNNGCVNFDLHEEVTSRRVDNSTLAASSGGMGLGCLHTRVIASQIRSATSATETSGSYECKPSCSFEGMHMFMVLFADLMPPDVLHTAMMIRLNECCWYAALFTMRQ
jgi:hypothetical protein